MSCYLFPLCVLLAIGLCEEAKAVEPAEGGAPKKAAPGDAPKATSPPAAEGEAKEKPPLTTQEAFAEAQKLLRKNDLAGVVEVLQRALPANADDVNLLLSLAQFTSKLASADAQKPDYAKHRKAAEYMRQGQRDELSLCAGQRRHAFADPFVQRLSDDDVF
ncbi:MAG TPA: hypothetical protein PK867_12010 [Pirellulales bacterium]|nr:hypothetical protein [Pirellulales bacterium]